MAEPPPPPLLDASYASQRPVDVLARARAMIEQGRANVAKGKELLAKLNPPRDFESLISGRVTSPPVQLDFFGPPKPRKRPKPREPDLNTRARGNASNARC